MYLLPAPGMLGLGIAAAPSCGFIVMPGGRRPTGGPGGGYPLMPAGVKPIGDWPGMTAGGPGIGNDGGPKAGDGCGASDPHRLRRRLFFSRLSVESAQCDKISNVS